MNPLAELDQLNLNPAAKKQVAALLKGLTDRAEQDAQVIEHQQQLLEAKDKSLQTKDIKITALTHELAYYKRIRYGKKAETLSVWQRDLFDETLDADISAIDAEVEQLQADSSSPSVARPKRQRAGRQALPDHLPRIEHYHEPAPCDCGQCGQGLVKIGEDVTEQLDVEPAKFFVHRHIRPKYACRTCDTVIAEPVSPAVIDGGIPIGHKWPPADYWLGY